MPSYAVRGVGAITAAAALALTVAPLAESSVTLGPCTITALKPTPIAVAPNGKKIAAGRAEARCTLTRQVQIETRLYGDDLLSDDFILSGWGTHDRTVYASSIQTVGMVRFCSNPGEPTAACTDQESCNEDIGDDELYSRARARFFMGNPRVYGAWSDWDKGPTVTYYC